MDRWTLLFAGSAAIDVALALWVALRRGRGRPIGRQGSLAVALWLAAVDRLMALRPDVVVVPGDGHQGSSQMLREELSAIRALLGRLRAPGGVWFVEGDHEDLAEARLITAGTRVRVLDEEIVTVPVGDRPLTIGGIGPRYRSAGASAVMSRLERAPGKGDVRVLLAHRPDAALLLPPQPRTDLVVAGHTHGGQVALPFVGPLMAFTDVPLPVAAGGLHDLGAGRRLYVSRGVGVERGQAPRVRLNVAPEISLLTLAQ